MSEKEEKFQILLNKAKELGYRTEVISVKKQIARLSKGGKSRFIIGPLLPLNTTVSARLSRDKNMTKKILSQAGINTPQGGVYEGWSGVVDALQKSEISFPLVVKPNNAALGSRVSVDIREATALKKAFAWVQEEYPDVLIEEFLPWEDHRLFVVDGKMLAAAKRVPPYIIGDGISTLAELIENLNQKKKDKKVRVDAEARRYLALQERQMDSIITNGEKVIIRGNANIQTGGFIVDVTDSVDPKFKEIAENCAYALGMRLAGVDILCEDIGKAQSKYAVTELNGLPSYPYIHDHPDEGTPRDPIVEVLKAVFRGF